MLFLGVILAAANGVAGSDQSQMWPDDTQALLEPIENWLELFVVKLKCGREEQGIGPSLIPPVLTLASTEEGGAEKVLISSNSLK